MWILRLFGDVVGGEAGLEMLSAVGRCGESDSDPGAGAGLRLSQAGGNHAQGHG